MRMNGKFYKSLLDHLKDGVLFVDRTRKITFWSRGAEKITGCTAKEVVGKKCSGTAIVRIDKNGYNLCEGHCPLLESIDEGREVEIESFISHKEGHLIPIVIQAIPIRDAKGRVSGAVQIFRENSQEVAALQKIEKLEKMVMLDPLTGLGNRRYIELTLHTGLERMKRYHWPIGVLLVDIDGLEKLNRKYGREFGDEIIRTLSRTFLGNTRSYDFIGRWGEDKFIAILENVTDKQLASIAETYRFTAEHSITFFESKDVQTTVSIAAQVADPDKSPAELIQELKDTLLECKRKGGNCVRMANNNPSDPK